MSHTAAGRAKYQIRVMICDRCKQGFQQAGADQIQIDRATLDAARCDAIIHGEVLPNTGAHVGGMDEPARQRAASSDADPNAPVEAPRARTRTTIPPAVRRRVLERDRYRCRIPGCRHTLDLEVHHIVPRADGGTHDPEDLSTICGGHHRAIHAGRLLLSGTASALIVRHADGSPYGAPLPVAAATNADIGQKVFGGLRGLGYKETEAKRALARALAEHGDGDHSESLTAQTLLKSALALLAPPKRGA